LTPSAFQLVMPGGVADCFFVSQLVMSASVVPGFSGEI
jgi:hypothetical protein